MTHSSDSSIPRGTGAYSRAIKYVIILTLALIAAIGTLKMIPVATTPQSLSSPILNHPAEQSTAASARELGPVVAMTNSGNLDFAMNWVNSLRRVGVREWIIFATDEHTLGQLQKRVGSADAQKIRRMPKSVYSGKSDKQHYQYRSAGWTEMMHSVPRLLRWLAFEEIKGPVLYSDTDIVWLDHPYSAFPADLRRFDLVASVDGRVFEANPTECPEDGSFCGGLMYLQHSDRIAKLLDDWEIEITRSADGKNQPAYNAAISANRKTSGLKVHTLDCAAYVNGWRAFCPDIVSRKRKFTCKFDWSSYQNRSPVMIHATYTVGKDLKIERLKKRGLWWPYSTIDVELNSS
ncbi:hypothetical protein FOZ62_006215 [Perkinsus olseni]|uniref:Nucleotide-diphospho-sugar transferase domain-containing protein n=1 Tax=Perkinsus olseni TaxID=32597 RepID=A0A7J6Q0N0_PEROL|nr:hypothetical protein FOZ62_006215 [Perkinsus olseni]